MKSMKLLTKSSVVTVLPEHVLNLRAALPLLFFAVFCMTMTSCSDDDDLLPEDLTPWYEDMTSLKADFAKALADAQWPDALKGTTELTPIRDDNPELEWETVDGKHMVLVCAMLNHANLRFWEATDTFRLTKQTGLWVTLPSDWKHRAKEFAGMDSLASRYRMIQMLGLWPDCDYDTMVEFYVDADALFRPAYDPSITTTTSGVNFPEWANDSYVVGETNFREWFDYQKSVAYVGDYACPWTQLGYTYDWHHGASRVGLSEFVASVGALSDIKARLGSWTFIREMQK